MSKCSYCEKDELLPFHCPFCHRDFCLEHRLPENHECGQSPARTPLGPWYAKKEKIPKVETPQLKKEDAVKKLRPKNLILAFAFIAFLIVFFAIIVPVFRLPQSKPKEDIKPKVDMHQKIKDEIPGYYSISKYDWTVWSKIYRDSGGILTKMNTWEQFKESIRQSYCWFIMLDEEHQVVWFKISANQVIYYEY